MTSAQIHRFAFPIALAALLSSSPVFGAGTDVFDQLSGGGGSVRMQAGPHPDVENPGVRMLTGADGDVETVEAHGAIRLEADIIYLECVHLTFKAAESRLLASKEVVIRKEGISATCEEMEYVVDTGRVVLGGSPDVSLLSGDKKVAFGGMDRFQLTRPSSEQLQVELSGQNPIEMDIRPEDPSGPSSPSQAAPPEGFSEFGEEVNIRVSPRGEVKPLVTATLTELGELVLFKATGSVRLKSPDIDLRSNELLLNQPEQAVEAVGNVFFKAGDVEADCGRLVYDLATRKTTLTIKPDIRQRSGNTINHISGIDRCTLVEKPAGGWDIDMQSIQGALSIERITVPEEEDETAPPASPEDAREILID